MGDCGTSASRWMFGAQLPLILDPLKKNILFPSVALMAMFSSLLLPNAEAVPAFSRQTGMTCAQCHTDMPILTETGRRFKLEGYTSAEGSTELPPLSVMLQGGFTHTKSGVPGGAAEHFAPNDNVALGQASLFYTGPLFGPYASSIFGPSTAGFLNKIGVFAQMTYDGVGRSLSWDNVEFRYADKGKAFGKDVTWGIYLNNNPTLQDPWQTLPAWGFPTSGSPLAATPGAATMIDGGFSQQVWGIGTYALFNKCIYVDVGGYRTLPTGFQRAMGVDPTDEAQISGLAPYWRLAYTTKAGSGNWEIGTFGMAASTYPGRDHSAGKDRTVDFGFDTQYQTSLGSNNLLGMLTWTHEHSSLNASKALAAAENGSDNLWKLAATVDVLHDKTYGGALQYFVTDGTRDNLLHGGSANGSPYSDGIVAELNWLPFHKKGGPSFLPNSELKLSVQYTIYNHFDGTSHNASANNTLYLGAWFNF